MIHLWPAAGERAILLHEFAVPEDGSPWPVQMEKMRRVVKVSLLGPIVQSAHRIVNFSHYVAPYLLEDLCLNYEMASCPAIKGYHPEDACISAPSAEEIGNVDEETPSHRGFDPEDTKLGCRKISVSVINSNGDAQSGYLAQAHYVTLPPMTEAIEAPAVLQIRQGRNPIDVIIWHKDDPAKWIKARVRAFVSDQTVIVVLSGADVRSAEVTVSD